MTTITTSGVEGRVERILDLLASVERRRPGTPAPERSGVHRERIAAAVTAGAPVQLVLPAFPAKSPNRRKVLSDRPDRAEELALVGLQELCDRIRTVHPPGARLTICSDGRVFADLVGVADRTVGAYVSDLSALVRELGLDGLQVETLDAFWPGCSPDRQRQRLMARFGTAPGAVRGAVLADAATRSKFNGLARFMFEDLVARGGDASRTRLRNVARQLAYRMLERSQAWSAAIAYRWPGAVRLSVHPQVDRSPKFGIRLLDCADLWMTPWHGVAVESGGRWVLMQRHEAERLGATVAPGGAFMRLATTVVV